MALTRCARRAIAKQRKAEKRERIARAAECAAIQARNKHIAETVAANHKAPKERNYYSCSTLGRLTAEQMGGGARVFGQNSPKRCVMTESAKIAYKEGTQVSGRTDRERWTAK